MAKAKPSKSGGSNIPQKHLHSRLSFLHQAATYLATTDNHGSPESDAGQATTTASSQDMRMNTQTQSLSEATRLLGHLRGVSRKSQIRLVPTMKYTICKRCDSLLIPGRTSSEAVVNPSKNGSKLWADSFEIRCSKCGTTKRFPAGADRRKIAKRKAEPPADENIGYMQDSIPTT